MPIVLSNALSHAGIGASDAELLASWWHETRRIVRERVANSSATEQRYVECGQRAWLAAPQVSVFVLFTSKASKLRTVSPTWRAAVAGTLLSHCCRAVAS